MSDLTIDDLVDSTDGDDGGDSSESDGGSWMLDLFDRLEDRGLVEPLLLGEDREVDEIRDDSSAGSSSETEAGIAADGLDADRLKGLLLKVYDNTGMIPGLSENPDLKEMIQWIDGNEEMVDGVLEEFL